MGIHRITYCPLGPKFLIIAVGLERGPFSFVRINEELLEKEVTAPV
jgi:hypothetical protein